MPTDLVSASNRFSTLSLVEVLAEQDALLVRWAIEDDARRARNATILASL